MRSRNPQLFYNFYNIVENLLAIVSNNNEK